MTSRGVLRPMIVRRASDGGRLLRNHEGLGHEVQDHDNLDQEDLNRDDLNHG